jgi:toxin ParE1/3/4
MAESDVVLRFAAREELAEGMRFYESKQRGLGQELLSCVEAAVEKARRHPTRYRKVHGDVRRVLVRRFPFGVFYLAEADRVVVLAIFHASRDPKEWQRRG